MSITRLLFSEIRFRWFNFALSLVAVAVATTLFVAGPTLLSGYARDTEQRLEALEKKSKQLQAKLANETRKIMRDLGVNLRIVHKDTNMVSLYTEFVAPDFPEEYVERLAKAEQINTIVHLIATLQERITWKDRKIFLVGVRPVLTQSQKNEEKKHMVKPVKPGTVLVGHELGRGLKEGESLEIQGHKFKIAKILPEYGEERDVQLVLDLHDAQKVLNKPQRINQIMALNCKCKGDRISIVRRELEGVLPDTKVTEQSTRASARETQRDQVAKAGKARMADLKKSRDSIQQVLTMVMNLLLPAVVFGCAVLVGILAWLNVRERRPEIGVLRALGKGAFSIASLLLMRAALTGIVGGLLGAALYYGLLQAAPASVDFDALQVSLETLRPSTALLAVALLGAPLISVAAAYLPTLLALRQDPTVVLMDQ